MPRARLLGENPKPLRVWLPKDLYEWLKRRAEEEGVEVAKVVRKIFLEARRREMNGD